MLRISGKCGSVILIKPPGSRTVFPALAALRRRSPRQLDRNGELISSIPGPLPVPCPRSCRQYQVPGSWWLRMVTTGYGTTGNTHGTLLLPLGMEDPHNTENIVAGFPVYHKIIEAADVCQE